MSSLFFKIRRRISDIIGICVRIVVSQHRRDNHLIAYGGALDLFIDNAKHLFILNNKLLPQYRHIWLTRNDEVFERVKSIGYEVLKSNTKEGIQVLYRAGIVIYDNRIDEFANHNLSAGAFRIELWHAVQGVKKIGGIKTDPPIPFVFKSNFEYKYLFKHIYGDYGLATSKSLMPVMSAAFQIPIDKIIVADQPRNHTLYMNEQDLEEFVNKYEDNEGKSIFYELKNEKRMKVIYMPTFRDADPYYIYKAIPDWDAFNLFLRKHDIVFYLKVHRVTPLPQGLDHSNIHIMDNGIDIYPILPLFDRLVTDYSSIMFDFSLMRKPVIIYDFDIDTYMSESRYIFKSFIKLLKEVSEINSYKELCFLLLAKDSEVKPIPLDDYYNCPGDISSILALIMSLE